MRQIYKWVLGTAVLLALGASSFAVAAGEGETAKLGQRNPSGGEQRNLTRETEIIAQTNTYGTRQSNKSDNGGGAIYGCRSKAGGTPAGNEPCVRSSNLADGNAFEFSTGGALGGTISATGGDNAKPFTTNATGVATGLNADRVDSKSAEDIAKDAVTEVTNKTRFAAVGANGTLGAQRGVASATRTGAGTYTVVFSDSAASCAFNAVQTDVTNAGAVAVQLQADNRSLTVVTRDGGGADGTGPTAVADHPFHVTATCL